MAKDSSFDVVSEFDKQELDYIVKKHDNSWKQYLSIMNLI